MESARRRPPPIPLDAWRAPRERRRHVVYLTRNTEYHCRGRECVGVRDRRSGYWSREHPALRGAVVGGLEADRRRFAIEPAVGLRLVFACEGGTVMTTRLRLVGRPDRESVFAYTSLCRAGEISR
jgi:hypothetical protein